MWTKFVYLILLFLFSLAICTDITPQMPLQQTLAVSRKPLTDRETTALLELHKYLVDTESISGNEHDVSIRLASYLRANRFTVELQELPPLKSKPKDKPRYNVYAYRGKSRKTSILLTSHLDTVPPFYGYEIRNKTELWGRGSVDAKACVATQIVTLISLLDRGIVSESDVGLLYVVGEEVNGVGMKAANDLNLSWDAVVFGEPTDLKLAEGHKGAMVVEITAHGKAGHSGYPSLGESAISMILPALQALENLSLPSSEKYGNTTLNIGRLEGGVAPNVIPERAFASAQLRVAASSPEKIKNHISKVLKEIDDRLELEFFLGSGAVPCDVDIDGFDTVVVSYGTDIPYLHGNHKRYLYGPGSILVAHSDHEHLNVLDLLAAVDGYRRLVCKKPSPSNCHAIRYHVLRVDILNYFQYTAPEGVTRPFQKPKTNFTSGSIE